MFQALQLVVTCYIYRTQPFEESKLNYLEMFNETMILITSLSLPAFISLATDPVAQYNFGWCVSGIMLSTVLVNSFVSMADMISSTYESIDKAIKIL